MEQAQPQSPLTFEQALVLFEMIESELHAVGSRNRLEEKRETLLLTWHPARYANLTNNPKKYMKMYKQGESMTKEIRAAFELLAKRLETNEPTT